MTANNHKSGRNSDVTLIDSLSDPTYGTHDYETADGTNSIELIRDPLLALLDNDVQLSLDNEPGGAADNPLLEPTMDIVVHHKGIHKLVVCVFGESDHRYVLDLLGNEKKDDGTTLIEKHYGFGEKWFILTAGAYPSVYKYYIIQCDTVGDVAREFETYSDLTIQSIKRAYVKFTI